VRSGSLDKGAGTRRPEPRSGPASQQYLARCSGSRNSGQRTRPAGGSGHREAIQRLARSRIAVHAARGHLVYGERARKRAVATREDLTVQEAQIARLARDA
jgi:hypothetical protein